MGLQRHLHQLDEHFQPRERRMGALELPHPRSRSGRLPPVALLHDHCLRQRVGNHRRSTREVPAHRHELLHHIFSCSRLPSGISGDAVQCIVRSAGTHVVLWNRLVRHLEVLGCVV